MSRAVRTLRSRGVAVLVPVLLLSLVAACSSDEPVAPPVPVALQSQVEDTFEFIEHEDATYVVGHRLALEVDPSWHVYDSEVASLDGTTWEWAAGQPESGDAVPAYLSIYAGIPGSSKAFDVVLSASKAEAEGLEAFGLVSEGSTTVPGAVRASYLRFTREVDYRGATHTVEEARLFVEVEPGVTTTLRFFSPAGEWDQNWSEVRATLRVSP